MDQATCHTGNEATLRFIAAHREEDVRALALQSQRDGDVDLPWALEQIQGWQTARRKLPSWAARDGIVYPPHLSMEQCSSEQTALYKCSVMEQLAEACRETLVDLTGGFGVDFAFLAPLAKRATYVERQAHLCEAARHNFALLGLEHAQVINAEAEAMLEQMAMTASPASTLLYLDPARRDSHNGRTHAIADCTPDVLELKDALFRVSDHILIKLSPMLDWHKAVSDLGGRVSQVHIVGTGGECKELLMLLSAGHEGEPEVCCVNDGQRFTYRPSENDGRVAIAADVIGASYLYEPNSTLMKAGCFAVLTQRFHVNAVANDSHLFLSDQAIDDFPGRRFAVAAVTTMNKKELGRALKDITRANVAVRNFPMSAQALRQRLHMQDGGDTYIFGTTAANGVKVLFICRKLS